MTPWKISLSWRFMLPLIFLGGSIGLLLSPLVGGGLVGLGLFYAEPRGYLREKLSVRNEITGEDWLLLFRVLVILLAVNAVLTSVWMSLLRYLGISCAAQQEVAHLIARAPWGMALWMVFSVTVLSPLFEEILFRRLLYGLLLPLGEKAAFAGTALLFAGIHGFAAGFPALLMMGLAFQYVYQRSGNFLLPCLLHASVNFIASALLIINRL